MMPFHMSPPPQDVNTLLLPIRRGGHFFKDDSFQQLRTNFETAVREVLDKRWNRGNLSSVELIPTYRQLRLRDPCEESQAFTISKNDNFYKVRFFSYYSTKKEEGKDFE